MRRVKKFIGWDGSYTFPVEQNKLETNFAILDTQTLRLPGLDGVFDLHGWSRSYASAGEVRVGWELIAPTPEALRGLRDGALKMAGYGPQRLFIIPSDAPSEGHRLRWCWARVQAIQMDEDAARGTTHQPVEARYLAAEPVWYGRDEWLYLDDGWYLDGTWTIPGPPVIESSIAAGSTIVGLNDGSHATRPVIRITANAATLNPSLTQASPTGGIPLCGFVWLGSLEAGETLVIDCERQRVIKEDRTGDWPAYAGFEAQYGTGFPELLPGPNTFTLGGACTDVDVSFDYANAWY